MKRIAAHRVYHAPEGLMQPMEAVELDDAGCVVACRALAGETGRTEWLPGLLVLSPVLPERKAGEALTSFLQRIAQEASSVAPDMPCRAYRIVPFNVFAMEFFPDSRVVQFC